MVIAMVYGNVSQDKALVLLFHKKKIYIYMFDNIFQNESSQLH